MERHAPANDMISHRRSVSFGWATVLLLFIITASVNAQMFPDTIYAWRKTGERLLTVQEWRTAMGDKAAVLEAYGASEFRQCWYARDGKTVRIETATLPSRERAFGFFTAMTEAGGRNGIIGDAFSYERGAAHVNTGPFYFRVLSEEKRPSQPPDEALVVRTRRLLYARADCYGSDIPLPTDERVLGSEHYLVPHASAWQILRDRVGDALLPVLSSHAAYAADYVKGYAGVHRTLVYFPFRQKTAAAGFAAELVQQIETQAGRRNDGCAIPAYVRAGVQRVVSVGPASVYLIISDAGDAGCCEWAQSLQR